MSHSRANSNWAKVMDKLSPKPVVIIDADTFAYKAAAATDGRYYVVEHHKSKMGATDGDPCGHSSLGDNRFKYKKDAEIARKNLPLPNETRSNIHYDPEPEGNALKILENSLEKFTGFSNVMYVTGNKCFRYDIIDDYKGNRKGTKPVNLPVCKQYLINNGAILDENLEADDLCIIQAKKCERSKVPFVIVGCDKDLKQIAGLFYDPYKDTFTTVTKAQARFNLWSQIASGDSTDNIRSPKGIGPKTFEKFFKDFDWDTDKDIDALKLMVDLYKTKAKKIPTLTKDGVWFKDEEDDEYTARILMWIKQVASLVFLRRGAKEEYQLPNENSTIIRKR